MWRVRIIILRKYIIYKVLRMSHITLQNNTHHKVMIWDRKQGGGVFRCKLIMTFFAGVTFQLRPQMIWRPDFTGQRGYLYLKWMLLTFFWGVLSPPLYSASSFSHHLALVPGQFSVRWLKIKHIKRQYVCIMSVIDMIPQIKFNI